MSVVWQLTLACLQGVQTFIFSIEERKVRYMDRKCKHYFSVVIELEFCWQLDWAESQVSFEHDKFLSIIEGSEHYIVCTTRAQVDSSTTWTYGGTGLGLAIPKQFAWTARWGE